MSGEGTALIEKQSLIVSHIHLFFHYKLQVIN